MINAKIILWIRRFALLLLQMTQVLGCGPQPSEIATIFPTTSPPTSTRTPAQTQTPTATVQPTETKIPTPTLTPFVPKAVIKIFSHVPLSGDLAQDGQDILHGAELAVQQLSGPLNEYRFKVELVPYDDQNLVETALVNAQEIIDDSEILCGVGHYDADITIAASDIYHEGGLAFINPTVTTPLLTDRSYPEVNRLIARIDRQGLAAAQFAKAEGFNSVFIVSQRNQSSLSNAEYFRTEAGSLGIKRLGSVIRAVTDENRDEVVSQIMNLDPELIYMSSAANQTIQLVSALRAAGYKGSVLGTESLNSQSRISKAGASLVEEGSLYFTITNPPMSYYSNAAKFAQDFENQYRQAPLSFAARAYDATGICLKAIEEATRAKGGMLPTRAEVAKAIRALKDYRGITGTYNFNIKGDLSPAQYYVYQVVATDPGGWNQNPIAGPYEVTLPQP